MNFKTSFRSYIEKLLKVDDPIDSSKKLVGSIQQLVGIHNVFGDRERTCSFVSLIATLIFGGSFFYTGTFSQLVYLAQVIPDKMETFKSVNCLSAISVPLSKFIFMWTSRSRLKEIFEMSYDGLFSLPNDSPARSRMLSVLTRGRYASWLVIFNVAFSHTVYLFMPLVFTLMSNERYLPATPGGIYGLNPQYETPFYETTFVITIIATLFSAINQTGYIVLFVTLLSHELGHFYAITETLNSIHITLDSRESNAKTAAETIHLPDTGSKQNIVTGKAAAGITQKRNAINRQLVFCVKHHQFLMKFHAKIRDLYKVIFGAHFAMMTLVLVTTLQTMNAWDIRNTILTVLTAAVPLFLYCFGGELLLNAGTEMSHAVYSCGWHLMEKKERRIILLLLCLSQHPLYLTAADFFVMNRETFGNVAQIVYKIYAVFK